MNAIDSEEAVGYCRTCVATGCHKHIYLSSLTLFLQEILKETRHKTCTYILECECGTVEEFE